MSGPDRNLQIEPCPPGDLEAALTVLYRRSASEARTALVAETFAEVRRGELNRTDLWIARRRGKIVGALLTQTLAGGAAAVWAPEVAARLGRAAIARSMVRSVLVGLGQRGIRLVQALVDGSSPARAIEDLTHGGLPRVTELVYLARDTATPLSLSSVIPPLAWVPYSEATAPTFREVIEATYQGSLDMPELEGARSLDDVLASHSAGGRFDPNRWQLGRLDDSPDAAALVLLSDLPDRGAWEVTYLGLTPSARGRGLGRAALSHALTMARPHAPRLELAVDVRNHPADRLYRAAGFVAFDQRAVHLAILPRTLQVP